MNEQILKLKSLIEQSNRIVFFGGAGVSTESNIPDFRSEDGLYSGNENRYKYPPEVMLSHHFYEANTAEFFDFYFAKMIYKNAKPNPAHYALAKLEEQGKLTAIITQNIDGLHQDAGSKNVLELHGSVKRNYCEKCHAFYDLEYMLSQFEGVPKCDKCGGTVKPDVVLYGESLDENTLQQSVDHIADADLLIVGGTSLQVYPAAGLIRFFQGNDIVLINKTQTGYDERASLVIREGIGSVLHQAVCDATH